jgi:hypothetical protein
LGFDGDGSTELNFGHRADWNPPAGASATMMVLANPAAEATARGMLSKRNTGGSFPQVALTGNVNSSGVATSGSLGCFFRDNSGNSKHAAVASVINGNYRTFACVLAPATGVDNKIYVDGVRQTVTAANVGAPTYTGSDPVCVGSGNAVQYFNDNIVFAYYWPYRELTAAEMLWLAEEPYAFVKPIIPKTYFVGGTTLAITGTSAVTAAAATLAASGTLVNVYSGTSALSAAPATLAASGSIVNAYSGSSALTAAAATLAASGTAAGVVANRNKFMLLGIG